jgi:MFS family permease
MIGADLLRGAAVALLTGAVLLGWGRLPVIFAVSLAVGIGSVFFQVSYQAFVPEIVEDTRRWHAANTRLSLSESLSLLAGPALGGVLIATLSVGGALAFDELSYAISVVTLLLIGRRTGLAAPPNSGLATSSDRMVNQIAEGLRYVRRHAVLNAIMWTGVTYNLGAAMFESLLVLFALRDLALSPAALGLAIGIGGIGFPIGSLLSRHVNSRIGMGPALILAAVPSVGGFLVAGLASGTAPQVFLSVGIGLVGLGQGLFAVNAITLRQEASAPELRARTTSVHRFATWGALPVGALLGGGIGELLGVRPAIFGAFLLASLCFWPLFASPLRHTRGLHG